MKLLLRAIFHSYLIRYSFLELVQRLTPYFYYTFDICTFTLNKTFGDGLNELQNLFS
jgi:hypothetical protein